MPGKAGLRARQPDWDGGGPVPFTKELAGLPLVSALEAWIHPLAIVLRFPLTLVAPASKSSLDSHNLQM